MFLGSFAWSFVYVSLPFHIQRISTVDAAATLRWTGWILGISNLVTVVAAPFWARYAATRNPKRLFVIVQTFQGVFFFATAAARTLLELFVARFFLGAVGAVSTFAFIGAGRGGDATAVRRQIGAIQSGMTIGQVIGPLAGALVAARIGFRASFVVGGVILVACSVLVQWGLEEPAPAAERRADARRSRLGDVLVVALIVLVGSTQIFFLTAILPQVVPQLGVDPADTLEVGGLLIFLSGLAAALGALAASRLGEVLPEARLIPMLLVASSALLALAGLAHTVWLYGTLRFLQVLCIAPVFPVVVARIAMHASSEAIGFINSARIGAAFLGPVIATTMLAWTTVPVLHAVLAVLTVAVVPLVVARERALRPSGVSA
jgi:MFS family permease